MRYKYRYRLTELPSKRQRLDFNLDCIKTIDPFAFEGLYGLTDLDLSANNISIIQKQAFANLPRLKHLDLSDNRIKYIEIESFSGTESISTIYLRRNKLSEVPSIGSQPRLKFLDLSQNRIKNGVFPPSYTDSKGNLSIDLSENELRLSEIDFSALAESTIVDLRLSRNHQNLVDSNTYTLPLEKFKSIRNLKNLYLDNCKINGFEHDFSTPLISLRVLDLSDNTILFDWEPLFKSMPYLQTLHFENSNLGFTGQHWTGKTLFSELKTLKQLFISNNNIFMITAATFNDLVALKELSLSNNKISGWGPDVFRRSKNIVKLDISNNNIVNLKNTSFHDLIALKVLDISNNKISGWGPDVFRFSKNIVKLDISFNVIPFLTENNLKDLINLQELFLNGNYFICTCNFLWFREWIDNTNVTLPDKELYTCHGPEEWRGKPVLEFTSDKTNCTKSFISYTNIVGAPVPVFTITGALVGSIVLVLIMGILIYKNRWRIRLRIYLLTKRGRLFVETQREREQRANEGDHDHYDAYISCCEQDYDWALHHLLPDVDNGGYDNGKFGGNFKLYFDPRDKDIGKIYKN